MRLLPPLLTQAVLALVCLVGILAWSGDAHAYPWMIKYGYAQCSSCHVDPSGGELLTHMGRVQSDELLSFGPDKNGYPRERAGLLFGLINEPDSLRLGGSARGMGVYKAKKGSQDSSFRYFPMQADIYGAVSFGPVILGGSLGYARVKGGSPHARAAQVTTGQGYDPNLLSRTHYIGFVLDKGMLLRLGRLNLPFGQRIPEHVMWVRESTLTDRESDQQHGVALAYTRKRWRSELMGIAGNYQVNPDEFRQRGYAGYAEYLISPTFGIGVSSMWTKARRDRLLLTSTGYVRNAHGVTARVGIARKVAVLAEMDLLKSSAHAMGYTGMLQADYEPIQGLHGMGTFEFLDEGKSKALGATATSGAGKMRTGIWLSAAYFIMAHLDTRLDVVVRKDDPLTLQAQIHLYF
ncbi:MAG TPA: hypothetical protein VL137_14275 [Polyangiaceae bacterium]|jgi:hypothetical protein|nr:hypothetical protein [Polyangiaceae bacterium]